MKNESLEFEQMIELYNLEVPEHYRTGTENCYKEILRMKEVVNFELDYSIEPANIFNLMSILGIKVLK